MEAERFLDGRVNLYTGDCLEVLAGIEENSVDSCVTDPPYHLTSIVKRFGAPNAAPVKTYESMPYGGNFPHQASGGGTGAAFARMTKGFMGKQWDGGDIAFQPEVWAQVFRVLKPGGYLLAFGGTRTYHRMACAIEDAGFEVRDCISWNFGSGFPKSHDVGKKLDVQDARCRCDHSLRGMWKPADDASRLVQEGQAPDVLLQMQRSAAGEGMGGARPQGPQGPNGGQLHPSSRQNEGHEQSSMEGRGDIQESPRQLRECEIRAVSAGTADDGAEGRVHHGASLGHGAMDRASADPNGMRPSSGSQASEQQSHELGTMAGQSKPQERGTWSHCRGCGKPMVPDGLGTALKPAMELICMARKPLSEGTVAANVLKHGTGAINVDGCRIESGGEHFRDGVITRNAPALGDQRNDGRGSGGWSQDAAFVATNHPGGRWPANVIHDGSEEVTAAFPETGVSSGGKGEASQKTALAGDVYGKYSGTTLGQNAGGLGDSGSAARFFYSSKADADDRLGSKHPTIKPVDLMQYLVRLVTPKGGTVLDPFSGTGTTGEAAWREGMCAILIERETEYQDDIRRRMALAMSGPDERARESIKQRIKNKPRDDGPLFGYYPPIGGES